MAEDRAGAAHARHLAGHHGDGGVTDTLRGSRVERLVGANGDQLIGHVAQAPVSPAGPPDLGDPGRIRRLGWERPP